MSIGRWEPGFFERSWVRKSGKSIRAQVETVPVLGKRHKEGREVTYSWEARNSRGNRIARGSAPELGEAQRQATFALAANIRSCTLVTDWERVHAGEHQRRGLEGVVVAKVCCTCRPGESEVWHWWADCAWIARDCGECNTMEEALAKADQALLLGPGDIVGLAADAIREELQARSDRLAALLEEP